MKVAGSTWTYAFGITVLMLGTASAIALGPAPVPGSVGISTAQAQMDHPFQGHSIVYVRSGDRWREAFIAGVSGTFSQGQALWVYQVNFLDAAGGSETNVTPDRLATIAEAQAQGLTDNVYDLSTQAGIDQMLAAHNQVRQAVGVADLVWSDALAELAQDWADRLLAAGELRHRPAAERDQGRIGENLASMSATAPGGALRPPQRAVAGWVAEQADYHYERNTCQPGKQCGHYTQMVWADTTTVGCAVARNELATREVWVCNYTPAGNVAGQRPY